MPSHIPTTKLKASQIPSDEASLDELIKFANSFDGYRHWGSFERCAEIGNAQDHTSLDRLRTCLFFEARRWRHFGDEPDDEALRYWRRLIAMIREGTARCNSATVSWLANAIRHLPSDPPAPPGTQGYNRYVTQRDHWLGWLDPEARTGTYPRRTGANANARTVYNRIGEPKMLLWLIEAAEVDPALIAAARDSKLSASSLAAQCAAFRRVVPWLVVAEALILREQGNAA